MFRNKEIRQFIAVFLCVSFVFLVLGWCIHPVSGLLIAIFAIVQGTVFLYFTKIRYKNIAKISEQIDRVLHNAELLYISDSEEGELSVLQSEIMKMTVRIREQNDALKKEKEHLADSLADIAHQLRTPLTSVNLILSLLERESDENKRMALLQEAEELFSQMDWLLTSLLKLSRLDAGIVSFQNRWIDLEPFMQRVIRPFMISMELHDMTVEINVAKGAGILGDVGWLLEAMQNILKNCMESAGDHGKIDIICEDTLLFTEIMFHDSGAGFKKEDFPHMFDRFYRGKNEGIVGYGIGLALCRTIITRQGGTITAKNHPEGGAVFILRFPK